jgi:predicted metal-dependent hydrolase
VSKWNVDLEGLSRGIALFNRGEFFEAHEVLEDVWRPSAEPERRFLQALIQVAVGLHHHSKGNSIGAASLLRRASRNLEGYADDFCGIALAPLRQSLEEWCGALVKNERVPPLPKFVVGRSSLVVGPKVKP